MSERRPAYVARIARAMAAAWLAGPWTKADLMARGAACLGQRPRWLETAARWTLHSFPATPELAAVVARLLRLPSFVLATSIAPLPRVVQVFFHQPPPAPAPWPTPQFDSVPQLASWLGIDVNQLQWLADVRDWNRRDAHTRLHHYHPRWLAKRSGGERLVEVPKPELKRAQRLVLHRLLAHVPPHDAAHGFCRGRSVLTHAALHTGQAVVVRLDLTDFFSSVGRPQIRAIFAALGYNPAVAGTLAGLCTTATPLTVLADRPLSWRQRQLFHRPHLPQGAPTSPALANLCAFSLDVRLTALAAVFGARYSRYADDLTLSGGADAARIAQRLVEWVALIAAQCGFAVNHRKTAVRRQAVRQQVCGIVVNQKPNLRRADVERLRAILTNCVRHGPHSQNRENHPQFRQWLEGHVSWVQAVNPGRGARLRALFEQISW